VIRLFVLEETTMLRRIIGLLVTLALGLWNLWILDAIRDKLVTLAAERDISPSQLVQEFLWKALTEWRSSVP
jgi:hypothetical protein